MYRGYWAVFSGEQPIVTFASFDRAWRFIYELNH
jgi:hypothetical protein